MKRKDRFAASVAKSRPSIRVSIDDIINLRSMGSTKKVAPMVDRLAAYEPAKGVLPDGITGKKLAMDAGFDPGSVNSSVALQNVNAAFDQGYAFPGFTVLSEWAQIPEFRRPAEVYAREITRKWIEFQATGEDDKTDKIKDIKAEFDRLDVQRALRTAIEQDGFFGRSQIYLDFGDKVNRDRAELKTPLSITKAKIAKGSLERITVIEPIWSYPNVYNADDPISPWFYKPTSWFVMGKEIHSSRLLTIVSRKVPDVMKPAYAFSGLSLSQMIKPYVENWLRTRQSVSDLVHAFTVWTLKTDLSTVTNQGGMQELFRRLQLFNLARDNHGVNAVDKDKEDFSNVSAPLGGLDHLQAQSQEHMAAPSGLPLVYLTGITPSGLNASSQGEIEVFQDTIAANQEVYSPAIKRILDVVQLSLFGEIDPEITFRWNPLKVVSATEQATVRKTDAETDQVYMDAGVLMPDEVRERLASEEDSIYPALDLARDLPEPVTERGDPGPNEEGLGPLENRPQEERFPLEQNADPSRSDS